MTRSRSNDGSETSGGGKVLGAPKSSDDYEDRVKMIITKELAKEKVLVFIILVFVLSIEFNEYFHIMKPSL